MIQKLIIELIITITALCVLCTGGFGDEPEEWPGDTGNDTIVTENKTTEELPPLHVPEEGEYLYQALNNEALKTLPENLPVRITVHVDRMGYGQEAVFEKGRGLEEAVDAFLQIRVGPDGAPMVTDNYNWFLFEWEDGTSCMIRLNLYCLEYYVNGLYHSYYLTDAEDFWRLAQANLR